MQAKKFWKSVELSSYNNNMIEMFSINTSLNLLMTFPLSMSQTKAPCLAVAPTIQFKSPVENRNQLC